MEDKDLRPRLDVDRDRIRDVVSEALRMVHEYVDGGFVYPKEKVMEELEKQLSCGFTAATFRLALGSVKYPDMILRVDPRRREAAVVTLFKRASARVNRILRAMR